MMFGQEEFIDVISTACILEYLEYKKKIDNAIERNTRTEMMVYIYLLAAEETQKGIYSNYMDDIVLDRVINCYSPENKRKLIYVSHKFFNIDIRSQLDEDDPFDFSKW